MKKEVFLMDIRGKREECMIKVKKERNEHDIGEVIKHT